MKAKGRYLVARIVVFKDQRLLSSIPGGAYAVWDGKGIDGLARLRARGDRKCPLPAPAGAPPSTAAAGHDNA